MQQTNFVLTQNLQKFHKPGILVNQHIVSLVVGIYHTQRLSNYNREFVKAICNGCRFYKLKMWKRRNEPSTSNSYEFSDEPQSFGDDFEIPWQSNFSRGNMWKRKDGPSTSNYHKFSTPQSFADDFEIAWQRNFSCGKMWKRKNGPSTSNYHKFSEPQSFTDDFEITWKRKKQFKNNIARHPPNLRGREIGLYYARRRSRRNSERLQVSIPCELQRNVQSALCFASRWGEPSKRPSKLRLNSSSFQMEYNEMLFDNNLNEADKIQFSHYSFAPDPSLDQHLRTRLLNQVLDVNLQRFREKLPVYKFNQKIVKILNKERIAVISGETGSGKTTQIAQFILDDYIRRGKGSLCSIVCTQPRRISAISVAARVAEERGEISGNPDGDVGYQIRLDAQRPRFQGSILFCTSGIILQELTADRFLSCYSHIILDEVHERDINTDFLITILRDLWMTRLDLHLILMSATLNAQRFSSYFWNCSMIDIPGFTFPVEELFLEDAVEACSFFPKIDPAQKKHEWSKKWRSKKGGRKARAVEEEKREMFEYLNSLQGSYSEKTIEALHNMDLKELPIDLIVHLIKHICHLKPDGGILVFMTGWKSIKEVHRRLTEDIQFHPGNSLILPLHSLMPTVHQQEIFNRPPEGIRKIIIATNIAETSITIDDIVYVIDCGKIKLSNFDVESNLPTLNEEWIALANSKQRKGRAGRVQPGICYHTYTHKQFQCLDDYLLPEMLRTRLEEVCLRIKNLRLGKIENFLMKAMDPPSFRAIKLSIKLLNDLQALDFKENLTPLGYHLAQLPVHPQMGKMILLASIFSCIDPILTVAASLSFKEPFIFPLGKERLVDARKKEFANGEKSDHIVFINAVKCWEECKSYEEASDFCYHNFLSESILQHLVDLKKQLAEHLADLKFLKTSDVKAPEANINSTNLELIKAIICAGLYPNIIQCYNKRPRQQSLEDDVNDEKFRGRFPKLRTKDENVMLHPKSVNCKVMRFEGPCLVYHTKVKSTCVYIYDCTMVTPFQLLFFGGKIDLVKDDRNDEIVTIDEWVSFSCQHYQALLVKDLRKNLDDFLAYKINNPGITLWNSTEKYFPILSTIVDLITSRNWGSS